MTRTLILGSIDDLHPGIHAALLSAPPRGFRYEPRHAKHVFAFAKSSRTPSPYGVFHAGEFLDFEEGTEPVHGYQWPVLGRKSWIAELPDISNLTIGRYAYHPKARSFFQKAMSASTLKAVREKIRIMLRAYLHPSCKAVLCHADGHKRVFKNHLAAFSRDRGLIGPFLKKCRTVRPVLPAGPRDAVIRKWKAPRKIEVLFCGKSFDVKNGSMALETFAKLSGRHPRARFTYVGGIPAAELKRHREILASIEHHPVLPRECVLELFRRSHVLFHPSRFEGYGMVFAEAAAYGLAVVAATGEENGMHTEELFGAAGAVLVNRDEVLTAEEPARFEEGLETLLEDPERAREMGLRNHREAVSGIFSIRERDATLQRIYRDAFANPARKALEWRDLVSSDTHRVLSLGQDELRRELETCARRFKGFKTVVQV